MTTITLLTKPDCALCGQAKAVLARVSADVSLVVEEVPLDGARGRAIALASGFAFAPGVLVDGEAFSFGRLSERKLRRALTARSTEV